MIYIKCSLFLSVSAERRSLCRKGGVPGHRMRFMRPGGRGDGEQQGCANLYVANCGPAVGLSLAEIAAAFGVFGEVAAVQPADGSGARVVVCFTDARSASAAVAAWGAGGACAALNGRALHIRYSNARPKAMVEPTAPEVAIDAEELGVPGVNLIKDFVSAEEEKELLAAVDARPWSRLAKRRVQHYGHAFLYQTRNVDAERFLGEFPSFLSGLLVKIASLDSDHDPVRIDQLTVNEYPPGVGLSPHVDTHSAFCGPILSLSLAGSCIMEFRKYSPESWKDEEKFPDFTRTAIFLPPRSMLVMTGEARYAWHHYIPHHKVDLVGGNAVRRARRRVSFTLRKVRRGPCRCNYPDFCDSQRANHSSSGSSIASTEDP